MCGIGCFYSLTENSFSSDEVDILRSIHVDLSERGRRGAGIALFSSSAGVKPKVFKTYHDSATLWKDNEKAIKKFLINNPVRCILFHCRLPTSGSEKDPKDIHPIIYNSYFLVHNGCVNDESVFPERKKAGVDTEAILRAIIYHDSTKGGIDHVEDSLSSHISGSMACAMFDTEKEALYIWRDNNPIDYVKTEDGVWFTSNKDYLRHLVGEYLWSGISPGSFPGDTIMKIDRDGKVESRELREHYFRNLSRSGYYGYNYEDWECCIY